MERREILRGLLAAPLAALKPVDDRVKITGYGWSQPIKALKGEPLKLVKGIRLDGMPQAVEVLLDVKDKDDLVLTNIEETYYFTR